MIAITVNNFLMTIVAYMQCCFFVVSSRTKTPPNFCKIFFIENARVQFFELFLFEINFYGFYSLNWILFTMKNATKREKKSTKTDK